MKKYLRVLYLCMCFSIVLTGYVHAYLDPSVMTYTVQIIAGVVIAVSAVVGILWRRAKKKVQNKLGIDENAKKEVEDEIVEYMDEEKVEEKIIEKIEEQKEEGQD